MQTCEGQRPWPEEEIITKRKLVRENPVGLFQQREKGAPHISQQTGIEVRP